jgi:hypothetical protein
MEGEEKPQRHKEFKSLSLCLCGLKLQKARIVEMLQ